MKMTAGGFAIIRLKFGSLSQDAVIFICTSASSMAVIGHYTTGNTGMVQSAPTNKLDISTHAPRVLFITG